jgi:hypothetical protein
MYNRFFLSFALLLAAIGAQAQQWSLYGGGAVSYDAVFRDAGITMQPTGWPFKVSGAILAGCGYKVENGFDVFAEATTGYVNINLPVPDGGHGDAYMTTFYARLMAGSGPRILSGDKGNSITPYLQLGGIYLQNLGYGTSGNNNELQFRERSALGADNWAIAVGGGIDWRFQGKLSSSINLNFSYTPLNIFKEPFAYNVTTAKDTYDINMQGKLLQLLLSYRIHLNLGRQRD